MTLMGSETCVDPGGGGGGDIKIKHICMQIWQLYAFLDDILPHLMGNQYAIQRNDSTNQMLFAH